MPGKVFIETYGCQMNEADSELMGGLLSTHDFQLVGRAEDADIVLLNTCAVRERAEERIFGRLGWLKSQKAAKPGTIVGVAGCMAERMREDLLKRAPYVDIIVGPDAYRRLPELIEAATAPDAEPLIDVRLDRAELYDGVEVARTEGVGGWLTIMRGCDKFCSFCVVPFVRGRERCVPAESVVTQAREMAAAGFVEITLLGQSVTSYRDGDVDFTALLRRVHDACESCRIRFVSPYPRDFDDPLLHTLGELPRVGRHLHLPVQSGSNRILDDMRRGYTVEDYRALVDRIRDALPDFSLTTDLIVGYPTESDADFAETLSLVRDVRFDGAFMFKYSERAGTFAARNRVDDVPDSVKTQRLQTLVGLQETISRERYRALIGHDVEVLIVGPSKRDRTRLVGRSHCFRTTVVPDRGQRPGQIVVATVADATSHTLIAEGKPQ